MCKSKKANEAAKQKPSKPVEDVEASCHQEEVIAKILSVEFLDGTDDAIVTAEVKQFINLTRDVKWVDGVDILNIDRCSEKPRIKVRFDQPGTHTFKLKFVVDGGNIAFTTDEKNRNPKFKFEDTEKDYTTGSDGTLIITDFFVSSGGNDVYSLSATDSKNNTKTSTGKIRTWKYVWYVEVKMKGLTSMVSSLGTFESEYKANYITLKALSSVEMDAMENIGEDEQDGFKNKVVTAFQTSDGAAKSPHAVALAYTGHLAVKDANQSLNKTAVDVGPGKPAVAIRMVGSDGNSHALWRDVVTGEDWFVSCKYLKTGGNAATESVDIPKVKCSPDTASGASYSVSVEVDHLPAETGTITLTVNWANRWRAGISLGGNVICACTKATWATRSEPNQLKTIIHEMGHKIGMTANGLGKMPEKITSFYDNSQGHVGKHCHTGIATRPATEKYTSFTAPDQAACVMYGSSMMSNTSSFCAECKKAVRKVDISSGF